MNATWTRLVSPAELRSQLVSPPTRRLLDVRTPGEFESVHVAGALAASGLALADPLSCLPEDP